MLEYVKEDSDQLMEKSFLIIIGIQVISFTMIAHVAKTAS